MANPNQKLNIIGLIINGITIKVNDINSLQLGGVTREEETGDSGQYFRQVPKPFLLEASVVINSDTSIDKLRKIDDAIVNITFDSGQTFTVSNAWVKEADVVNKSEGTLTLSLAGNAAVEVK